MALWWTGSCPHDGRIVDSWQQCCLPASRTASRSSRSATCRRKLVERVADAFRIEGRYTDHHAMLAAEKLDIVAVINCDEHHADCGIGGSLAGR